MNNIVESIRSPEETKLTEINTMNSATNIDGQQIRLQCKFNMSLIDRMKHLPLWNQIEIMNKISLMQYNKQEHELDLILGQSKTDIQTSTYNKQLLRNNNNNPTNNKQLVQNKSISPLMNQKIAIENWNNKVNSRQNYINKWKNSVNEITLNIEKRPFSLHEKIFVKLEGFSSNIPRILFEQLASNISASSRLLCDSLAFMKFEMIVKDAVPFVFKLNKMRIGDSYIKAYFVTKKKKRFDLTNIREISDKNNERFEKIFSSIYSRFRLEFVQNINKQINEGFNLITYKTHRCLNEDEECFDARECDNFHARHYDKRRNPMHYNYCAAMCPHVSKSVVDCIKGDFCPFSHNSYEEFFHPSRIRQVLCSDEKTGCIAYPNCSYVHPDTPELLFTSHWRDVAVLGLQNSMLYLAYAVKAPGRYVYENDATIFFVSSSESFLEIVMNTLYQIPVYFKYEVAHLHQESLLRETTNVLLGTPEMMMANEEKMKNHVKKSRLLIIDDIDTMYKDEKQKEKIFEVLDMFRSCSETFNIMQKVILFAQAELCKSICNFYNLYLLPHSVPLSQLGRTPLYDLQKSVIAKAPESNLNIIEYVKQSHSTYINRQYEQHGISSQYNLFPTVPHYLPSSYKESYPVQSSNKTAYSSDESIEILQEKLIVENKYTKRKIDTDIEYEVNKRRNKRKDHTHSTKSARYRESRRIDSKSSRYKKKRKRSKSRTKSPKIKDYDSRLSEDSNIHKTECELTEPEFYTNLKLKILEEHIEEMQLYKDVPDIHNDFEREYKNFLQTFSNDEIMEINTNDIDAKWIEYWHEYINSKSDFILYDKITNLERNLALDKSNKEDKIEKSCKNESDSKPIKQKEELLSDNTYIKTLDKRNKEDKIEISCKNESISKPIKQEEELLLSDNSGEVFSLIRLMNLIEKITDNLDIFQQPVQELIDRVREAVSRGKDPFCILHNDKSMFICELVLEKFICLRNETAAFVYEVIIKWFNVLLVKIKQLNMPKTNVTETESGSNDSDSTLQMIKNVFIEEGKIPSEDVLMTIYLNMPDADS